MTGYLLRRVLYMLLLLWVLTVVSFVIIQLPRGDYVTTVALRLATSGEDVDQQQLDNLRRRYGLDRPVHVQYLKWFFNLLRGEFGHSFMLNKPVSHVVGDRLALTITISLCTLVFTYLMAIPIGIYSATHQYRFSDYLFMSIGFIGLAIPNFLLAIILMFFALQLGIGVGGLFSPEYLRAGWSVGKFLDLMSHLPLPVIIVGTAGTAGLIRVMRAQLLDELSKQYVVTARAKGVAESRVLFKYPVRVAVNPMISTVGWLLPVIVSGETITSLVLGLPTVGPLLFSALMNEDMFLAAALVLFLNFLTVVGTFISDILLTIVDPRIRFSAQSA